ncbi:MAG: Gfo/Idh/MocA family protein [Cytophagaceae bacterium]
MKKRIGIAGLGNIAQKVYLPLLSRHTSVEIVGIMSRKSETVNAIGNEYRLANRFTDMRELLDQKPDAVFVHASTESHFQIVCQCLQQGIHVYVDKPFSYSIKEAYEMVNLAEKNKLLLGAGFNRRFAPLYIQAKDLLTNAGGFSNCVVQKHRTKPQDAPIHKTLYDDLIHMLDLLLWLSNGKYELRNYAQKTDSNDRMLRASGMINLGDADAYFSMDRHAGSDLEKMELHGNGCSAEVLNMESARFSDQKTGEHTKGFGSWDDILYRRGFTDIVNHFLESLDKPSSCLITGKNALATHELVEKCLKVV